MVVTNIADISADMEPLSYLLEAALEELNAVTDAEENYGLNKARALLAVFEERFDRLYREVVMASARSPEEQAYLDRVIPF